jgi:hypothetical protein
MRYIEFLEVPSIKETRKHIYIDIVQGNGYQIPHVAQEKDYYDIKKHSFPEFMGGNKEIKKHFFLPPQLPVNPVNKLIRRKFITDNNRVV